MTTAYIIIAIGVVGVLTIVHSQVNYFTQDHLALQQAIADMAGIAITNARLYEEIEHGRKRYYDLFEDSVDPILVTDLKGKMNQQASSLDDLEGSGLGDADMDLRRKQLEKQRDALRKEYDLLMKMQMELAQ